MVHPSHYTLYFLYWNFNIIPWSSQSVKRSEAQWCSGQSIGLVIPGHGFEYHWSHLCTSLGQASHSLLPTILDHAINGGLTYWVSHPLHVNYPSSNQTNVWSPNSSTILYNKSYRMQVITPAREREALHWAAPSLLALTNTIQCTRTPRKLFMTIRTYCSNCSIKLRPGNWVTNLFLNTVQWNL